MLCWRAFKQGASCIISDYLYLHSNEELDLMELGEMPALCCLKKYTGILSPSAAVHLYQQNISTCI